MGVIVSFGLVLLLLGLFFGPDYGHKPTPPARRPIYQHGDAYYLELAYSYAKYFVGLRIKAPPHRIEWPPPGETKDHIAYLGDGRYEISSWYNTRNHRGERTRQNYVCVLLNSGDKWIQQSLKFY